MNYSFLQTIMSATSGHSDTTLAFLDNSRMAVNVRFAEIQKQFHDGAASVAGIAFKLRAINS
jgi:hypothetical protein